MQFKQYPNYKPSGVEWLGDVPEHWQVKPNKYVFKIQKRIAGTLGFNVLSITQKGLKIKDIESNAGQMAQDYSKYQIVNVGDFAMNHMDLLTGWIDIAKVTGVTSPDYRVFEVRNEKVNKEYFLHLFQLGYRDKILFAFGQGAAQMGRWRLQSEAFNTLKMPSPSIEEQQKIVSFLDTETARIDNLIAKQEKLIELLEEQRKSIISHAVTKGLNPNVPMKDSGVEWLGEVPEHWIVCLFKRQIVRNDGGVWGEEPTGHNDTIVFRSTEQTMDGRWNIVNPALRNLSDKEKKSALLEEGDLLLTKSSGSSLHIGKTTLVDVEIAKNRCCYSNFMQRIRTTKTYNSTLGWYVLNNQLTREQFSVFSTSTTGLANLNSEIIGNVHIVVPPVNEQLKVIEYLDTETARIDTLIAKQEKLIEKLKEYRSSIIFHAVTGKIDIREFC